MPPGYNVPNRNERSDGYWGVLLATSSDLIDTTLTIDIDCEIATSKIELARQKSLIIMSAYRPPKNDLPYAQRLCQAIRNITLKYPSATLWLSGDFNLPVIDWTTDSIKGHQYNLAINNCFLPTFHDLGLFQMVDFPTRNCNTLDLFLTNRSSLVNKCIPLPGVSDHEMVLTMSNVRAKRQKAICRKVFMWKKADMNKIKADLRVFSSKNQQRWFSSRRHLEQDNCKDPITACQLCTLQDVLNKVQPTLD